jgi:hypothetical protein
LSVDTVTYDPLLQCLIVVVVIFSGNLNILPVTESVTLLYLFFKKVHNSFV